MECRSLILSYRLVMGLCMRTYSIVFLLAALMCLLKIIMCFFGISLNIDAWYAFIVWVVCLQTRLIDELKCIEEQRYMKRLIVEYFSFFLFLITLLYAFNSAYNICVLFMFVYVQLFILFLSF